MTQDGSPTQENDVVARSALLRAASEGKLDGLRCPRCQHSCVSVWFTRPADDLYRTWFLCDRCGFEMRAQNVGRPLPYSVVRDRTVGAAASESA
jgi:hypothetical protein